MPEPTDDELTDAMLDYTAERIDLEGRLPVLIAGAIGQADDPDRVAAMIRRGAEIQVLPDGHGRIQISVAYGDGAEVLAAMRSVVWDAEPEQAPARGSEERDEALELGVFPISVLATLPRG